MKILESKSITVAGNAKVQFIRIDPEDLSNTLAHILNILMDMSWLQNFDTDYLKNSYKHRATKTIDDIKKNFADCSDDKVTSDAGEYVVSELAREALIKNLGYLDIPLAELIGKKKSGNPGFDFHSQNNTTDTVIFGEAKYVSRHSAYLSALEQIPKFIEVGKDIDDIADLNSFCTPTALQRASNGIKGFAAAFSAKSTSTDNLIRSICSRVDFQALLKYEEIVLVAVNL